MRKIWCYNLIKVLWQNKERNLAAAPTCLYFSEARYTQQCRVVFWTFLLPKNSSRNFIFNWVWKLNLNHQMFISYILLVLIWLSTVNSNVNQSEDYHLLRIDRYLNFPSTISFPLLHLSFSIWGGKHIYFIQHSSFSVSLLNFSNIRLMLQ